MYQFVDTKQKSVSRWSKPHTPDQVAYYSTHAPKRRIYGLVQTVVQVLWAAVSYVACLNLFDWFFVHAPALQGASPYLAGVTLVALHVLLRTTYQTYWYDKLDNRTETDSSPILPLLIMGALVLLDYHGAKIFVSGQIEKQKYADTGGIEEQHKSTVAKLEQEYAERRREVESIYDQKANNAALPYEQKAAALRRVRAKSGNEAKYIRGQIADLERKAAAAKVPYQNTKSDSLNTAATAHQLRKSKAEQRRDKLLGKADSHNDGEDARYKTALADADGFAWIVSLFFMLVFALLGYSIVRINVKSGILPERQYTDLDAHGSALDKIGIAFSDAAKRQMHRFAVGLHNALAANARELTDFDGNVIVRDPAQNRPTLPDSTGRNNGSNNRVTTMPKSDQRSIIARVHTPTIPELYPQNAPETAVKTVTQCDTAESVQNAQNRTAAALYPQNGNDAAQQADAPVDALHSDGTVLGGEAFLRDATTRIRREIANLINANGRAETVAGRLVAILQEVADTLAKPNFTAPRSAVQKFLQYSQSVTEPVMKSNGITFDFQIIFDAAARVGEPVNN
jgi:uncharacterized membrane protein